MESKLVCAIGATLWILVPGAFGIFVALKWIAPWMDPHVAALPEWLFVTLMIGSLVFIAYWLWGLPKQWLTNYRECMEYHNEK